MNRRPELDEVMCDSDSDWSEADTRWVSDTVQIVPLTMRIGLFCMRANYFVLDRFGTTVGTGRSTEAPITPRRCPVSSRAPIMPFS